MHLIVTSFVQVKPFFVSLKLHYYAYISNKCQLVMKRDKQKSLQGHKHLGKILDSDTLEWNLVDFTLTTAFKTWQKSLLPIQCKFVKLEFSKAWTDTLQHCGILCYLLDALNLFI